MSKVTCLFTREQMEELDLPYNCIDEELIESHRWWNLWSGVFEYEGKYWKIFWASGATEMQDDTDPWFDEDTIIANEVVKLPVVRQEWVDVSI